MQTCPQILHTRSHIILSGDCPVGSAQQISKWFLASRDPVTGEYPDLPSEELGGSKDILDPPPPPPPPEPAAKRGKKAAAVKKPAAADGDAPQPPPQAGKAGGKGKKGDQMSAWHISIKPVGELFRSLFQGHLSICRANFHSANSSCQISKNVPSISDRPPL